MALKDFHQLAYEIDQAVHSNGPRGKTTASGLNSVLKSLATELTTLPQAVGEPLHALDYADAISTQQAGALQAGAFYLIGKRPTPALGSSGDVLVQAVTANAFAPEAILCTRVPDFKNVPLWRRNYFAQGPVTDTTYVRTQEPFVTIVPQDTDFVDYGLDDDDNLLVLPLPFPFEYGGTRYERVAVDTNGRVVLDPAHFTSEYQAQALAPGYAAICLCWGDLFVSPATARCFTTGQAPYRQFVVDFTNARPQTGIGNGFYFSGTFSGQLVLEETTNHVTLGFSAYSLTETTWVQGLQYPQHAYSVSPGQALSSGVRYRFCPVAQRAAVKPELAKADTVRWRGQTWHLLPGAERAEEPGSHSAWQVLAVEGADAFGNSVPSYDLVRYDLATDRIGQRRDARGNILTESTMAGFPWGHPEVFNNQLRSTYLDDSLLCTDGLACHGNSLTHASLQRVNLAGIKFCDNQLTNVHLDTYAPARFEQVTALNGLDPAYTDCFNQVFLQGRPVPDVTTLKADLATTLLRSQRQVACAVYRHGQPVSYRTPDFLHPIGTVIPEHDRIDLLGDWKGQNLWLRNFDFTISGSGVVVDSVAVGRGSTGQKIVLANLGVTGILDLNVARPLTNSPNLNPQASPTSGMNVTLTRCTIGRLALAAGASPSGSLNRYALNYCAIGRLDSMAAGAGTQHRFAHCIFGQGQASGSIFGGNPPATAAALVIANSVIYLNGTATLFDGEATPQYPVFENVTVVAADGTVSQLGTPTLKGSTGSENSGPGLEVIALASLKGRLEECNLGNVPIGEVQLDIQPQPAEAEKTDAKLGWDTKKNVYRVPVGGVYELTATVHLTTATPPEDDALILASATEEDAALILALAAEKEKLTKLILASAIEEDAALVLASAAEKEKLTRSILKSAAARGTTSAQVFLVGAGVANVELSDDQMACGLVQGSGKQPTEQTTRIVQLKQGEEVVACLRCEKLFGEVVGTLALKLLRRDA